jgi:hypothetical protein
LGYQVEQGRVFECDSGDGVGSKSWGEGVQLWENYSTLQYSKSEYSSLQYCN